VNGGFQAQRSFGYACCPSSHKLLRSFALRLCDPFSMTGLERCERRESTPEATAGAAESGHATHLLGNVGSGKVKTPFRFSLFIRPTMASACAVALTNLTPRECNAYPFTPHRGELTHRRDLMREPDRN